MYHKDISAYRLVREIGQYSLYEITPSEYVVIHSDVTKDVAGNTIGYSEMVAVSSIAEFQNIIDNLFKTVFGSGIKRFRNKFDFTEIEEFLLSYSAISPKFFKEIAYSGNVKNQELFDYYQDFMGTDEQFKEFEQDSLEKEWHQLLFTKQILIELFQLTRQFCVYRNQKYKDGPYFERIEWWQDNLNEDQRALLTLLAMLDTSDFNTVTDSLVSRVSVLEHFGPLDPEVMSKLGLAGPIVDNLFERFKVHLDYFKMKARTNSPLLVFKDPYKNSLGGDCLLSKENEILAWRGFTKLMSDQRNYVISMFEPEDRG